jgi:hypothetical protein
MYYVTKILRLPDSGSRGSSEVRDGGVSCHQPPLTELPLCSPPVAHLPSLQARDRGFSCPNPHPRLKREWVGVPFSAKATPSLAPNASGGVCFRSPSGSVAPRPLPLRCRLRLPHPRGLRSRPCAPHLFVDALAACALRLCPWRLRFASTSPSPVSAPPLLRPPSTPPPLRAAVIPLVSAHCVCAPAPVNAATPVNAPSPSHCALRLRPSPSPCAVPPPLPLRRERLPFISARGYLVPPPPSFQTRGSVAFRHFYVNL